MRLALIPCEILECTTSQKYVMNHFTFQHRSRQQKQSHLELFAQRDSKNREQILDRTLEENQSGGNFFTLIIEQKPSTIYMNYYMQ